MAHETPRTQALRFGLAQKRRRIESSFILLLSSALHMF
jgi:hypothetical protein